MIKLSIIIPYYNAEPYTSELLDCLAPQITNEVEVVIVDDGSKIPFKTDYPWAKVIRKKNGGVSSARNTGIRNSTGEYIGFIDADDLVADNYVQLILDRTPFDYLEMSWKSLPGGAQYSRKLNSINDSLSNPSACTRAFRREFIKDIFFNEKKDNAEDEEFTRRVYLNEGKKAVITEYAYFYRTAVEHSNSKKYLNGEANTKRIIYYFRHVTKDMDYLIDEIKKEDEVNEVYVMCETCDLIGLNRYARIIEPQPMRGMELRGEPTNLFTLIEAPLKTQVVIYQTNIDRVSGLTTFIYDFCKQMSKYYDITVLYNNCDPISLSYFREIVDTRQVSRTRQIVCNTLIMNSLHDAVPQSVTYDNILQMCHACNIDPTLKLPTDRQIVFVSKTSMRSWGVEKGTIIHNMTAPSGEDKTLILVSAMRTGTSEKGQTRMIEFAKLLQSKDIPFLWLLFTDMPLKGAIDGMVQMKPTSNIESYIKAADYVVALSDVEACSYTILESLWDCNTPLIVTPLDMLNEVGFKDGETGYIVPFVISDIDDDLLDRIVHEKPAFTLCDENKKNVTKWRKLLGNTKPTGSYSPDKAFKKVRVKMQYYDNLFARELEPGTVVLMPADRADEVLRILGAGYVEIVDEK